MRVIVVGLGNDLLGDDGVGLHVVRRLKGRFSDVDVVEAPVGGLGLLDLVVGYDAAVVVDAMEGGKAGRVRVMTEREAFGEPVAGCVHDCCFGTALEMGRRLGLPVPDRVFVVAVEVEHVDRFREGLTAAVAAAVDSAAQKVVELVDSLQRTSTRQGGSDARNARP